MSNTKRERDSQHWIMDWLIKQTGRYQNYAYDAKTFPPEVKSYKMIPRVMDRYGRHREQMARAAEAAGHVETAAELYFLASEKYRLAQHAIYEDDNKEKIYLHGKQLECYLKAAAYAPNPVELVEIPFEDNYIQGFLHLVPGGKKAPTVVFAPGMDMTKESTISQLHHPFIIRGMNFLSLDGPGKGTSNIRKIHVTADNYCQVGTAAIDFLSQRPEVDMDKIAVSGYSFGSYWGMQMAAADKRVKAIATAAACYGPMTSIFEEETPHFKQVFMYMAGIEDEAQFDEMANQMSLEGIAGDVSCPCLIISGEYDPLAPLDTVLDVYERVSGPKELWVVEDEFHTPRHGETFGGADFYGFLADWIKDALNGKYQAGWDKRIIIHKMSEGPYSKVAADVSLPERIGVDYSGPTKEQLGPAGIRKE
jgi:dipeptidyl aminopeptidase/acylaminoacyl peptidase